MTTDGVVEQLLAPLRHRGAGAYLGEDVTQIEHALQCADLAEHAGAAPSLVVAALLHDIGWLLGPAGDNPEAARDNPEVVDGPPPAAGDHDSPGEDDHAARGCAHLRRWLPIAVTEPVRLHVEAKRWLCATDPSYLTALSDASRRTLTRQGGPLGPAGIIAFNAEPWAEAAVALRRWDDLAKLPGKAVRPLDAWVALVDHIVRNGDRPQG